MTVSESPHPGRCFEDFEIGDQVTSALRTVADGDVRAFADLSGDHNPLHTAEEFATGGPYGQRIAHGLLGIAFAVGLIEQTGIHAGTSLAMLDIQQWTFRRPMPIGAQVSARMTVVAKHRSTRDPGRGVVVRHLALLDDDRQVLQEGLITLLVQTRDGG